MNFLILVLVNLMWALQFSGAKIATAQLGPITVTSITVGLAVLLLAPFLSFTRREKQVGYGGERRGWPGMLRDFLILGIAGTVVAQLFLTWGVKRSLASNASVLTLTIPVLSAVMTCPPKTVPV